MAIKSLLTASVLGVISAAVSSAAFADLATGTSTYCKPGFYAGIEGGRSDTFYHPSDTLTEAALNGVGTSTAYVYTTAGALDEITTKTSYNLLTDQDTDDIGIGGRIYAGYQFNPYFAVETGYTQYAKTSFHATGNNTLVTSDFLVSGGVVTPYDASTITSTTRYEGEITEHAIDLVAKGTLPLQYGFGLYAKAGAAYIQADRHINANGAGTMTNTASVGGTVDSVTTTNNNINSFGTIYTKTYQGFRPVAGLGVSYTIPCTNITVDVAYTRVFSYGGIPNAKLASVGAEYKFA
jgi:hypothetical protein